MDAQWPFCRQGFLHCPAHPLRAWQPAARGSAALLRGRGTWRPAGSEKTSEGCTSRPRPVPRWAGESPLRRSAERRLKAPSRRGAFAPSRGFFALPRPLPARGSVPPPAGWGRARRARWSPNGSPRGRRVGAARPGRAARGAGGAGGCGGG